MLSNRSYYQDTAPRLDARPPLLASVECDVAIIGAGLAGLSAGLELARAAWALSIEALDLIQARIHQHSVDCQWRSGYLSVATSPRKARSLAAWAGRMGARYGYALQDINAAQLGQWIASRRFHGAAFDARSGHLHPLRYTQGIARAAESAGAVIHEGSPVLQLERKGSGQATLRLREAAVRAHYVLLAGNVYLHGREGVRGPDFGRLPSSAANPGGPSNIYYLQGFSGHGLALTGMAGRLVAEAIAGDASRFDVFSRIQHGPFPGGRWLRTPALVLGMAWYRMRDLLG